jgi:hypothetical protein
MSVKSIGITIPLPSVTRLPNASAHGFPAQIHIQTYEFMMGAMFYATVADEAAGGFIRLPNGLANLENNLRQNGMTKKEWDRGWQILEKHLPVFQNSVFQNVLVLVRSHWDWYIRQLGSFVAFARQHVPSPVLSNKQQNLFDDLDRREIEKQLSILEGACGLTFNLPGSTMVAVKEMSLVRNLGLHNRWEVDAFYLSKTPSSGWTKGEIRIVGIEELRTWVSSLTKLLDETSMPIARKYCSAPDYP